jgi:hypothetical protein
MAVGNMKNLMFDHPADDVRAALVRLMDAMTTWERNTGRHSVIIIKDEVGGQYRALDARPVPQDMPDADLLQNFDIVCE